METIVTKLFIRLLLIVSIAITSVSYTFYYDYIDSLRINSLAKNEYQLEFYIRDSTKTITQTLAEYEQISTKYHVSVIKVTEAYDTMEEIIYSGVFYNETFPVNMISLTSGAFIAAADEFLSSVETNENKQVGTLFEFMGNSKVTINTLASYYDSKGIVDGNYRIVSAEPYDANAVLNELSAFFDVEKNTLTKQLSAKVVYGSNITIFSVAAIIFMALIFALLIVSVPIKCAKEMAVQKLMGLSSWQIWRAYLKGLPTIVAAAIAVVDVILLIIIRSYSFDFLLTLLLLELATFIVFVCLSALMLFILSKRRCADVLKESISLKIPLVIATILKTGYLILLVAFSLAASPSLATVLSESRAQQAWDEYGDLYVLSAFTVTDEDLDALASGKRNSVEKFNSIYRLLNSEYGAIFASSATNVNVLEMPYGDESTFGSTALDEQLLTRMLVNPNYLAAFPLYDSNGKQIVVSDNETSVVYLIPASREDEKDMLVDLCRKLSSSYFSALALNQQKIIVYQDNSPLFSFNTNVSADTGYYLAAQAITVLTEANAIDSFVWGLQSNNVNAPVKLPANTDIQALQSALESTAVAENDLKFDTIKNCLAQQLNSMRTAAVILLIVYLALFIVSVLASVFLVQIILMAKHRWLLVAKLHGIAFLMRYKYEVIFYIALSALSLLAAVSFSQNLTALPLLLAAIIVDIIVILLYIHHLEKKNLSLQLKGA
ncbi:MAG: hypothetical protein LBG97_00995 [Coriobacteriales bacterium]|jgi:hypothetical protein|nr:hypothetical protein [Coriobacteriales bacterium]